MKNDFNTAHRIRDNGFIAHVSFHDFKAVTIFCIT